MIFQKDHFGFEFRQFNFSGNHWPAISLHWGQCQGECVIHCLPQFSSNSFSFFNCSSVYFMPHLSNKIPILTFFWLFIDSFYFIFGWFVFVFKKIWYNDTVFCRQFLKATYEWAISLIYIFLCWYHRHWNLFY